MPLGPVETAPLFAPLHAELIALLRSLPPEHWQRQTVAPRWRVRDVAAHLLDGDLRKVAVYRDGHGVPLDAPLSSPRDVARLVNGLNASGVSFAQRLSPREITDLLEITGSWVAELVASLPPHGRSIHAVSWAGESESENWMDTGREYTERWHHQMQIRDAVDQPLLLETRWLDPLLDLSMRALPVAYQDVAAPPGTSVRLVVESESSRVWSLVRDHGRWTIEPGPLDGPQCTVHLSADAAWRLFYNALPIERAASVARISGDAALAGPLLSARAVIL